LALDRINGNLALRVGKVDVPVPKLDSPTVEYADALAALPLVEEQGDGFKSFIGIALHVLAGEQPIVLIDEPEAFLHPGQCRALGRWLAERARDTNRQILIATHDRDIILGLLQASEAVTVARLTREASASRLRQLSARDLQALWADPVLRYSNVLQGLFHEVVAVCEADADCRFYSAAVDATRTPGAASSDDVLFVPAGGKERIAKMARALAHIGVRVFALADFDVLKHEATIAEIVGAVGGDWSRCVQPYRRMTAALGGADSARWEAAKATGLAAVPRGEPSADATALLEALRTERVLVVPVGEMEGFDRTLGNKGGAWVTSALERRVHESSEEVADFVGALT
jgi:hypothetical protein